MKERPILFSAPMVRAILEGRKTQTRRIVKPQHGGEIFAAGGASIALERRSESEINTVLCSYGQPGDRLWVRETWQGPLLDYEEHECQFRDDGPEAFKNPGFCAYRATDTLDAVDADGNDLGWRPSIHMPRWASRILLEVTGVRVERLQDISEADAEAEGIDFLRHVPDADETLTAKQLYACLWDAINSNGSWEANHWVFVVEFKRVYP